MDDDRDFDSGMGIPDDELTGESASSDMGDEGAGAEGDGPAVDPRLQLSALLGMVNHTAQWYRPRGRLSPEEIADGYVALVLAGASAC